MVKVIISHKVKDYGQWRSVFDADEERRKQSGLNVDGVYRAVSDPNNIHMIGDASSTSVVESFMNDPNLAEAMQKAGVISKPEVTILETA
jgi:hypothetical protein